MLNEIYHRVNLYRRIDMSEVAHETAENPDEDTETPPEKDDDSTVDTEETAETVDE